MNQACSFHWSDRDPDTHEIKQNDVYNFITQHIKTVVSGDRVTSKRPEKLSFEIGRV